MKSFISFFLAVSFLISSFHFASSQESLITIEGTVIENGSGTPVEFATVVIADKTTKQTLTGTITDLDGKFSVTTDSRNFYIDVSFMGFETMTIEEFDLSTSNIDLGNLLISEQSATLSEITVVAERSQTEFKLDKRVFNVGQDLSSTGASALEVLNNVPSVAVSIEGDISLRGSEGVQILINGKPSVLSEGGNALGSITADMIERIEVITNPSAKYDAEGTTGILNIVLKKEEKKGMNGSVTLNTGTPANHSVGLSINRRTEKFNLFSQIGAGHRSFPNEFETVNRNMISGSNIESRGDGRRSETFYNFILGTDYHIDENNVVTLSGSYALELEGETSLSSFMSYFNDEDPYGVWSREENTTATNPKFQYELQYKRDFEDHEDHDLIVSAQGRFFGKDQESDFSNIVSRGNLASLEQDVRTDFHDANYTFKLDYTKPWSENLTLETGAQYLMNGVGNDFEVQDLIDNIWVTNFSQTNNFEFDQKVLGVYGTLAFEGETWGIKGGLRMEHTNLTTMLTTTGQNNNQEYTNLFPSVHTSYKFSDAFSVQAGYSKRIFRPRMWNLNPFFNIRNNFNIRTGNPTLRPEFTDSYEVNAIFVANKVSLNAGIYHRNTTDAVERVTTFQEDVSTTMPLNIGTQRTTGLEINGKYSPTRKITLSGDFNYNTFNRNGLFQDFEIDFGADYWSGRVMAKLQLPKGLDVEVTGGHRSDVQNFQGVFKANSFMDLGIRKKLMKGRTILNLSVRDVFASRNRESITDQPDFYVYNFWRRGRFVNLGLSYGFGKGEAMEYSSRRRRY